MKTKSLVGLLTLFLSILLSVAGCQKDAEDGLTGDGYPDQYRLKAPSNQGAGNYIVVLQDNFTETPDLNAVSDHDNKNGLMRSYLNRFMDGCRT